MGILNRRLVAVICAVLTVILVRDIVRSDILTRVGSVSWSVSHYMPLSVSLAVQSRYPDRTVNYAWIKSTHDIGGTSVANFSLSNTPKTMFTTKFVGAEGQWIIERVTLASIFGGDMVLEGEEIVQYFYVPGQESKLVFENSRVVLSTNGSYAEVFSRAPFRWTNFALEVGLPVVIGLVVLMLLLHISLSSLPSIKQLNTTPKHGAAHSLELDGLRGLAAIFVVADHSWGMFSGSGLFGVWIFFALSGYLLSIPFAREPDRGLDLEYVSRFYFRRLMRIVPMYYFVIFVFFLSGGEISLALSHFLFLQGNGHLWTIVQEMLFYLLLPLIMVLMALLMRMGVILAVSFLAVLTVLALIFFQIIPVRIYDGLIFRPPYFGWFMVGIFVSYFCHSGLLERMLNITAVDWFNGMPVLRHLVGVIAVILLFGLFALASVQYFAFLHGPYRSYAEIYAGWYAVAAGFLIFAAVVARSSMYGAILRFMPFRSFGILGYSVYLLHPMLLGMIIKVYQGYHMNPPDGVKLFAILLGVTWVIATFTYNLIEYPFLSYRVGEKKTMASA